MAATVWQFIRSRPASHSASPDSPEPVDRHILAALLTVSLLGLLLALGAGWYPAGDAAIHLQAVRKMISLPVITQPHYSFISRPVVPDHAFDTYYLLLAMFSRFSRIELTVTWHYLSGVLALFVPFGIYTLLRAIKAGKTLTLSSLVFLVLTGVFCFHGNIFNCLVYPNRIYLWLILPSSLLFFFKYLDGGRKTFAVMSSLTAVSQLVVHPNGFLFYYWILGGIAILGLAFPKHRIMILKKTILALVSTTVIVLPLLWLKFPYIKEVTIPWAHSAAYSQYYNFWYLSSSFFAFRFKFTYLDLVLGLVIAAIAVYRALRTTTTTPPFVELLLGASFFVPPFIIFNPLLMPTVGQLFTYVAVGRLSRLPFYFLAFAYGLELVVNFLKGLIKSNVAGRRIRGIVYGSVCSAYLIVVIIAPNNPMMVLKWRPDFNHHLSPIVKVVPHLKPGSTVLANELTSSRVASLCSVYTLVLDETGPGKGSGNVRGKPKAVKTVLFEDVSLETIKQILGDHNVDYILISLDTETPKGIFEETKDSFERVYSDAEYLLYKISF